MLAQARLLQICGSAVSTNLSSWTELAVIRGDSCSGVTAVELRGGNIEKRGLAGSGRCWCWKLLCGLGFWWCEFCARNTASDFLLQYSEFRTSRSRQVSVIAG